MKQKEISALSLEVVSQFFDGTPEPLIEHLSENVLWLGPRDGQFLRGKDVLCSIMQGWQEKIVYTLGNMSTQISPVGKKGMNIVLFYDILAHLPEGPPSSAGSARFSPGKSKGSRPTTKKNLFRA